MSTNYWSDLLGELVSEASNTHFVFTESGLQSNELITLLFKFIHSCFGEGIHMFLQLFIKMVQIDLYLVKLLIFALLFHFICFHFTFYDVANLEIKRHVVVVDTVQNNRIRHNLTRSTVVAAFSHFLYILFHVILNNLDPLNNNIFKNPLTLLQIKLSLIRVFIKPSVKLLLELEVHFIFPIDNIVNISKSSA